MRTDMRVEEQSVGSPGERFGPPVQVVVNGGFGQLPAVLVFKMFDVSSVFNLGIVNPSNANSD